MMRCFTTMLGMGLVMVLEGMPTSAQTPPSAAETAAYDGLHAAALIGDVAAIERLVAAGAAVDTRDGQRRTALHSRACGLRAIAPQARSTVSWRFRGI